MTPNVLPQPLVDVEWLTSNHESVRIVDVRSYLDGRSGRDAWASGHLPGATWLSLDEDLSAPAATAGGRHPLPDPADFAKAMGRAGITNTTPVVAYDDAGGTIAARLWWMLSRQGTPVAILDGGIQAWTATGNALVDTNSLAKSTEATTTSPLDPTTYNASPWPSDQILAADDVAERLGTETLILDARAHPRYLGQEFPVDPRYGHIPGARSAPATANLGADGRFESIEASRQRYDAVGALGAPEVVAYCGSGVTACADLLALERLGVRAKLYVGSWSDWGADPDRPLETGEGI